MVQEIGHIPAFMRRDALAVLAILPVILYTSFFIFMKYLGVNFTRYNIIARLRNWADLEGNKDRKKQEKNRVRSRSSGRSQQVKEGKWESGWMQDSLIPFFVLTSRPLMTADFDPDDGDDSVTPLSPLKRPQESSVVFASAPTAPIDSYSDHEAAGARKSGLQFSHQTTFSDRPSVAGTSSLSSMLSATPRTRTRRWVLLKDLLVLAIVTAICLM